MANIEGIQIKIGDTVHTLTTKEARELKDILCDLFGKEHIVQPTYIYRNWPYVTWSSTTSSNKPVFELRNTTKPVGSTIGSTTVP